MSEKEEQYRRWAALMDRKAIGEPLTPDELAFCESFVAESPLAQREVALMAALADLDVSAQHTDTRALVDGALARLAGERADAEAHAERETLEAIQHRAPARRMLWALGLATTAAAAVALMTMRPEPTALSPVEMSAELRAQPPGARSELVYASGEVTVDGRVPGADATLLAEGNVLEVGADGSACLAMDPEIDLCLGAGSRLVLTRIDSAARRLDLEAGRVAVQLSPQPEGMSLSIVADGVWSTAIGTAFTVSTGDDAANAVRTTVLSGKVRVGKQDGDDRIVAAHQRAEVSGDAAVVSAISRADESPEWALLHPATLWDSPVSATLHVSGLPAGAEIALDDARIGTAPLSTLIPVGNHHLEVRIDGAPRFSRAIVARAGQASILDFSDAPADAELAAASDAARGAKAPKKARTKPAAELLAEARSLMQQSRFEEATERYTALRSAHPQSAEARTVLVPLGQLQMRLGQPGAALASFDQYLAGGRGALAEEARYTRVMALRELGRDAAEAEAIAEFLELHPKSFQARALEQRLERLNR